MSLSGRQPVRSRCAATRPGRPGTRARPSYRPPGLGEPTMTTHQHKPGLRFPALLASHGLAIVALMTIVAAAAPPEAAKKPKFTAAPAGRLVEAHHLGQRVRDAGRPRIALRRLRPKGRRRRRSHADQSQRSMEADRRGTPQGQRIAGMPQPGVRDASARARAAVGPLSPCLFRGLACPISKGRLSLPRSICPSRRCGVFPEREELLEAAGIKGPMDVDSEDASGSMRAAS